MSDWTEGYVADIGYTYGYYTELNPLRVALAFMNARLAVPATGYACELGFGQGMSANVHAAAGTAEWWGTDFNPSQAAFAQELAQHGGGRAHLFDQAFEEFCARQDLPDFDYIGLHGIWSWISDDNRDVIVEFLRRKLKVGGVLYISYNTMPGWAAFAPLRNLLAGHSEVMGTPGQGIVQRIESAITFADKLMATNPAYAKANPMVADRLKKLREQNRNYLAHEFFNRDWHPMPFDRMAQWLEPAKLSFACSASYLDHIDGLNLTPEQQALLKDIPDANFREAVRDFCVNQQFRKDYWVKGPRRLPALEQAENLRKQRVVLGQWRKDVPMKAVGGLGQGDMQPTIYNPVLDALADHKPRTLGELEQLVRAQDVGFMHLAQALLVLIGNGAIHPVQDDAVAAAAKPRTDKINAHICNKARTGTEMTFLASPVTGGGVSVGRFAQLYLLARAEGRKKPAELAQYAWTILKAQGHHLMKDGKPVEGDEANLAGLTAQAEAFLEKQLPVLRALGIAA